MPSLGSPPRHLHLPLETVKPATRRMVAIQIPRICPRGIQEHFRPNGPKESTRRAVTRIAYHPNLVRTGPNPDGLLGGYDGAGLVLIDRMIET